MPNPVVGVGAAASLLGGAVSSSGQRQAAQTQADAAKESANIQKQIADQQLALQQRQYEEGVARQQPWLQAGESALNRMRSGEFAGPAAFNPNDPSYARPAAFNPNDPSYAQPGAFSFGAGDYQADPGYAFRLSEGQKALERSAAARGGLISGGALKAATKYGQDMGSQEYGNAFNRALTQYGTKVDTANTGFNRAFTGYNADVARSDTGFNRALTGYNAQVNAANEGYNRLAGMAGVGQTTAQNLNTLGSNYATNATNTLGAQGNNTANAIMAAGQANAAGQMGSANTLASAFQTGASAYQNQNNFNEWLNRQRPYTP